MNNFLERYFPLFGRILLAVPFIPSGIGKIFGFEGTVQMMAGEGMTVATSFLLIGAIVFELVGAFLILIGYKARFGALLLIIFLIPATLIFHDFWQFTGQEQMMQMQNFTKNLGLLGGLSLLVAYGAGALSFDARNSRPRKEYDSTAANAETLAVS